MLFNPAAKRFTFRDLRALAVMTDPALKKQLNASTAAREFAEHVYSQCRQTEEDKRLFGEELAVLKARSDAILKTAYEHVRQELAAEVLYGFGTKPPVTPQSAIDIIPPHYWLFLQLKPETSEAFGHGVHYVGIFFQRKEDVPPETIALVNESRGNASVATPDMPPPVSAGEQPDEDRYIPPYVQLQLDAIKHFSITPAHHTLKKTITGWLEKEAAARGIELSGRMLESLATSIRPPEAQKGGNKKQHEPAEG
jgi:hypothetical protein